MDFFRAQDEARRRTRWLVVWFALAVCCVVGVVYALSLYGLRTAGDSKERISEDALWIALGVGVLIVGASLFKHVQLAGGGAVVARSMGGRPVDPSTSDIYERRLVNVVEEMAIASGIPTPEIWVMDDEEGINAFAAGTEPGNAVVAVTRGCLERLTRSELQGVVAHEFSHILNGDMRLNLRLVGWVFGLVVVAIIGRSLVGLLRHARVSSGSSRSSGSSGVVLVILATGVSLWLVGSIGAFFARLLQAAISRQREFLADASAVQFTRDPSGIAGALKKIGGFSLKGMMKSPHAPEARHMFFAETGYGLFRYAGATHPPLDVRIRTLEPDWDGKFISSQRLTEREAQRVPPPLPKRGGRSGTVAASAVASGFSEATETRVRRATGEEVLANLEPAAAEAVRNRTDAKSLICGLLLSKDQGLRTEEIERLRKTLGENEARQALHWQEMLSEAPALDKIAYLELAIPALKRIGEEELGQFFDVVRWLTERDGQIDLFEFMLGKMLLRNLGAEIPPPRRRRKFLAAFEDEVRLLATAFARLSDDPGAAFEASAEAYREQTGRRLAPVPGEECTLAAIDAALHRCRAGTAVVRRQLLRICGLAAVKDGRISDEEAELLRAMADAIEMPMPPFVTTE